MNSELVSFVDKWQTLMGGYVISALLGLLLLFLINKLGEKSKGYGYINVSDIVGQVNNLGFNFFLRVMTPAVFISAVAIGLYYLHLDYLVKYLLWVNVFYFLLQTTFILLNRYWGFVNKQLYFTSHIISILISIFFYKAALVKGLSYILPDAGNFRTEIWFVVLIYFYNILNTVHSSYDFMLKRSTALTRKYREYEARYSRYLRKEFLDDEVLYKIFFSIMIMEDLNRTRLFRFAEKILFRIGLIKTTGIMQVKSEYYLSNEESISLAQEIILTASGKSSSRDADSIIRTVCIDYNGYKYYDQVNSIYHEISFPTDKYPRAK